MTLCDRCGSPLILDDRSPSPRCTRCDAARALDGVGDWFVEVDEAPVGPLTTAALRTRWAAGQLGPDTLVWRPGLADWQPVREVPDLHRTLAPPRAAPPRPVPSVSGASLATLASAELARAQLLTGGLNGPPVNRYTGPVPADPLDATLPPPEPPPRKSSTATAVTTFVLGVAVAAIVALMASERSKLATAPAAAPAPIAATTAAPVALPPPAAAEPAPAPAPAPPAAPPSEPQIARGDLAPSTPVRVSDPPAAREPPAARPAPKAKTAAQAERRAAKPARREPSQTTPPRKDKETRVALAQPAERPAPKPAAAVEELPEVPAPAAAPAPKRKATTGDPLLDAVSDDELERALGGGGAKPAARTANTVYVPPAPGSDLPEGVSPAQINDAVAARLPSLRGCIDEQRAADPSAKGTLKLRWVIAGDGSVRDVKSASGDYDGQPISRCVAGVVRTIRFPASRTQGQEVVFPFKF